MYSLVRENTRKQQYTSAFDIPFSSSGARTKEEGSKEEDRQEGADVQNI